MSADGAADLRRRAAPSARTRHGGEVIDAAEEIRLRAKPAPRFKQGVSGVHRQGDVAESFLTLPDSMCVIYGNVIRLTATRRRRRQRISPVPTARR